MEFLKDLYCRRVWFTQNIAGSQAVLQMGNIELYRAVRELNSITTVILLTIPKERVNREDIERGKVLPILEALDERPKSLSKAMISWFTWPNEERPAAVFISDGEITPEKFKQVAYTLAVSEIPLSQLGMQDAYEEALDKTKKAVLSKPVEV
jgi:hypothetical protein